MSNKLQTASGNLSDNPYWRLAQGYSIKEFKAHNNSYLSPLIPFTVALIYVQRSELYNNIWLFSQATLFFLLIFDLKRQKLSADDKRLFP